MNKNLRKYALISLYAALFVILSIFGTIKLGDNYKLTLQNLPIYIGAITLGSIPGALVGFIGMFISQIITYGFSATTLFWVLPQTILGAVCGLLFESNQIKVSAGLKFWIAIIGLQIFLTILNTVVMCIDALIFGYFNYVTILSSFMVRIMSAVLVGIVYCIVIPAIVKFVKKIH